MRTTAPLNLPPCGARIRTSNGRKTIFDPLRQRYVALTPEEWVRQHFVHYLTSCKGYPSTLLANEVQITLGSMTRRCDTVLYDNHLRARMIVEYKAPTVPLTQQVFDQIARYNLVLRVEWLVVSNGISHYCCQLDYVHGTYTFLPEIPDYHSIKD